MVVLWPARIKDRGGLREQFVHVIDVVPTILEAAGLKAPEVVDGIPQKPIEGTSFVYPFDGKNAKAPSRHERQYFEMFGQWALYDKGWLLSTKVNRAPWDAFGPANPDPPTTRRWSSTTSTVISARPPTWRPRIPAR